jgi:hypothetical protein
MSLCQLFPVPSANKQEFKWEWRAKDNSRRSSHSFERFHDCMEDARQHGFEVELQQAVGDTAPGHNAVS